MRVRPSLTLPAGIIVLGVLTGALCPGSPPASADVPLPRSPFSWALEIDEPYEGVADLSSSLPSPAGASGFVRVDGENLVVGETGEPVRFYGVNLASQSIFPEKVDAPAEAARLASMGFNLVRLHFVDRGAPGGVLAAPVQNIDAPVDDPWRIDPERLDRMFFFIAELKKRGIYITHHLFGYANFMPPDYARQENRLKREHFPIIVKSWEQSFTNPYRVFYRPGLVGFKGYIRELLSTRNPYTGLTLAEEPAVAFVEIANETGLVRGYGMSREGMPGPIQEDFFKLWRSFLHERYPNPAALKTAWQDAGPSLAESQSFSVKSTPEAWESTGAVVFEKAELVNLADATRTPAVRMRIPDSTDAVTGAHVPVLPPPVEGDRLRISFRARLDGTPGPVRVRLVENRNGILRDSSNSLDFQVGTEAADFAGELVVSHSAVRPLLEFSPSQPGTALEVGSIFVESANARESAGEPSWENPPPPFLAPLRAYGSRAVSDYYEFLFWLEKRFFSEIRDYLVEELGVRQPVVGTAVHAQGSIYANDGMDLTNAHHYHNGSVLAGRSATVDRVPPRLGKPHVMTELNSPNHPRTSHEMVVLTAAAAARQGFAAICFFDYTHGTAHPRRIPNGIHLGWDPVFAAMNIPARALFLRGDLPEAPAELLVNLNQADYIRALINHANILANLNLKALFGLDGRNYFLSRIRLKFDDSLPTGVIGPLTTGRDDPSVISADGTIRIDQSEPGRPWLMIDSSRTQGAVGSLAGRDIDLNSSSISVTENAIDTHAVFLTPMDGKPLRDSRSVIISAVGHVANPLFANRLTSPPGRRWSNAEFAKPALIEGVEGTVRVDWQEGDRVSVYALDKLGRRREAIPFDQLDSGMLEIPLQREYRTLWYEITREPQPSP